MLFEDERHISKSQPIDSILEEDTDLRIFYCDGKLSDDGVHVSSITADDMKKIMSRYDMSVIFLDRFHGRNRATVGSRKTYHPTDPNVMISYGMFASVSVS